MLCMARPFFWVTIMSEPLTREYGLIGMPICTWKCICRIYSLIADCRSSGCLVNTHISNSWTSMQICNDQCIITKLLMENTGAWICLPCCMYVWCEGNTSQSIWLFSPAVSLLFVKDILPARVGWDCSSAERKSSGAWCNTNSKLHRDDGWLQGKQPVLLMLLCHKLVLML